MQMDILDNTYLSAWIDELELETEFSDMKRFL